MRAAVLREFGGPEVLVDDELPDPEPGDDEVVIEVHAVSVNQTLDVKLRQGARRSGMSLPHVLGLDPAGVVVATGRNVDPGRVGERAVVTSGIWCETCDACRSGNREDCQASTHIGVHRHGGYAELVAVPASNAHPIGDELAFDAASVLMRHTPTALNLLATKAGLQLGETVLVMGASGGLGSAGVQLAKLMGATVIAGAGAPERVAAALELGADHGIDYRNDDLAARVHELTGGRGVDVVFENIGDPSIWPSVMASLAHSGRLVTAGAHGGGHVELDVHALYRRRLRLVGGGGHRPDDIRRALALARTGRLTALVGLRLPLRDAAEAHRAVETGAVTGKVVLLPRDG